MTPYETKEVEVDLELKRFDKRSFKTRKIKDDNSFTKLMSKHFRYMTFDKNSAKAITAFRRRIMNRHIEFLSNKYMGVTEFKIVNDDWDSLFLDVFMVEREVLQKELYTLEDIFPERKVTSNVLNLSFSYLLHRFVTSKLSDSDKEAVVHEIGLIYGYRFMSSAITERFKRPLPINIAKATVEALSYKFIIKKMNNWQEYFDYRADDLKLDGLHKDRMTTMDALEAGRVAIYINTAYRSTFNRYYNIIKMVMANNEAVNSSTLTGLDPDGEEVIKVVTDRPDRYINYILDIASDANTFIKRDLMDIVLSMMDTVSDKNLLRTLSYVSDSALTDKAMQAKLGVILEVNIEYLNSRGSGIANGGLGTVMEMVKGLWITSSVKDNRVRTIKRELLAELTAALGIRKERTISSAIIALVLYVTLRSIIRK